MAAIPDQGNPGEDLPAQPVQDDLLNAYGAGYTHDDVTVATGTEPPRPDIGEIWGGASPAEANWAPATPFIDTGVDPHVDAINEGAGPIGEAILGAAAGGAVGVAKGLPGAIGAVLKDVSGELAPAVTSRAAQLGVSTLETADTVAPAVLAKDRTIGQTFSAMAGNKWARRGAAAYLGYNAFYPNKIMQKAGY